MAKYNVIADDRVFAEVGDNFQQEDEYTYAAYVAALIADAVDYDESELSPQRLENFRYYKGDLPALAVTTEEQNGAVIYEDDANRSQAVTTDVYDTVMGILPSLIRIFTSSENVVDYDPRNADQVEMAKQATEYAKVVFWDENPGFMILHTVFKDLMINKIGVVKWWTDNSQEVTHKTFQNITVDELMGMLEEFNVTNKGVQSEIVDADSVEIDQKTGIISEVTVRYVKSKPCHRVEAVPPEEFRISRTAKDVNNAMLVGHESMVTVSYLIERGYDLSEVEEFAGNNYMSFNEEKQERVPGIDMSVLNQQVVQFGEYFIRVDRDNDGISELRKICTVGNTYTIIEDNPAEAVNMAIFSGDPTPHTAVGECVADIVKSIQKIQTQLLRGSLDSLSGSMFPDLYINQMVTNMEDALSDEVGKAVRVNGDPNAAVKEFRSQFVGGDVFEMMSQMDALRQRKTGISEASKGVDPKALQSTNVMGIDAIVTGAQERIELIARIIAETGFKDMFKGILREITQHPNIGKTVRLMGQWVSVNPTLYDPEWSVKVNPTLGRGSDMSRLAALNEVKTTQLMIIEKFGIANSIVTPRHFMNTISDILAIANIKNVSRYFGEVTEDLLQSIQNAPKEPSPEELIAKAEMEKIKAQTAKAIADLKQKDTKMAMDEDFRRDKLGLDSLVKIITALASEHGDDSDIGTAENIVDARNVGP